MYAADFMTALCPPGLLREWRDSVGAAMMSCKTVNDATEDRDEPPHSSSTVSNNDANLWVGFEGVRSVDRARVCFQ